jgi:bacteriocin-like protein
MKNSINNKVKALKEDAENQEEFMEKLAKVDEEGQLTDDMLEQISGGVDPSKISILIDTPALGMMTPDFPAPENF